jgi:CheY-like chemotaxis protein
LVRNENHQSGYALAHRLRALPGGAHPAVVALTDSLPYDEEVAREAGIEFRLSKPVRIDLVLSILEDVRSRPHR